MKTIDELIKHSATRCPERVALRYKISGTWKQLTYGALWNEVDRIGGGLRQWGLRQGDRVALIGAASPAWIAAYLGILQSGAIVVPVDKDLKAGELRHVLNDCGARLLLAETAYMETVSEIAPDLPALEQLVLLGLTQEDSPFQRADQALNALLEALDDLTQRHQIPATDKAPIESLAQRLATLIRSAPAASPPKQAGTAKEAPSPTLEPISIASLTAAGPGPLPPTGRTHRDPAVILYTSGTTGRSKGAVLSHANIVSNIESALGHLQVDETMHTLSFLPINHVFEQVAGILAPLSVGGKISIAESLKKIGQNLVEEHPTYVMGVPALYRLLLTRIERGIEEKPLSRALFALPLTRALVTSKVRKKLGKKITFVSGGAALDPDIAKGFERLGITILQGYGITETSPIISAECPGKRKIGTVGQVIPGVLVRIDNPNDEGVGEILVKGPNVMQAYYKRPKATAEVIVDGWYHTGDLGHMDENGYLSIRGRMKNLIVTPNGKNVYPEEVENELLKSPLIAEVMVYGHKLSATAEEVHAIIYPNQEALEQYIKENAAQPLTEADVEKLIREEVLLAGKRLADYKRVKKFTLRDDEFPKTTTRKIKRFVVEADIPAGPST